MDKKKRFNWLPLFGIMAMMVSALFFVVYPVVEKAVNPDQPRATIDYTAEEAQEILVNQSPRLATAEPDPIMNGDVYYEGNVIGPDLP